MNSHPFNPRKSQNGQVKTPIQYIKEHNQQCQKLALLYGAHHLQNIINTIDSDGNDIKFETVPIMRKYM